MYVLIKTLYINFAKRQDFKDLHADWKHPIMETVTCILQLGLSAIKWIFTVSAVVANGILTISFGPLFYREKQ